MSPEDRREQLLDAALRVLSRDGFDSGTIEGVAQEAGVSRPVVYDAFPGGLDELSLALLDRTQKRALRQALALLSEVGTIEDVDACTYANEEKFFSYRRMTHRGEADYGRHVNAVVLEG